MLEARVDYPILHALCCCLGKRAREIFWYMLCNYEKLPIRSRDLATHLDINPQVCYKAISELEMYNIIERVDYGEINFSFIAKKKRPVGVLIRTSDPFDDMGCAYREIDEE